MSPDKAPALSWYRHLGLGWSHRPIWVIKQCSCPITQPREGRTNQAGAHYFEMGEHERLEDLGLKWRSHLIRGLLSPSDEVIFIIGAPGNAEDGKVTTNWPAMCCCHGKCLKGQRKQMTRTIIWGVITRVLPSTFLFFISSLPPIPFRPKNKNLSWKCLLALLR